MQTIVSRADGNFWVFQVNRTCSTVFMSWHFSANDVTVYVTADAENSRILSCPEIPDIPVIAKLSWYCPEIRNCPEIFSHLVKCLDIGNLLCPSMWPCSVLVAIYNSFPYFLQIMTSVYYCHWMSSTAFSCDNSLFHVLISVTDLVHTSAEKYAFYVLSFVKPTKMSWKCPDVY